MRAVGTHRRVQPWHAATHDGDAATLTTQDHYGINRPAHEHQELTTDLAIGLVEMEEGYDRPAKDDRTVAAVLRNEHYRDGDVGQQQRLSGSARCERDAKVVLVA